MAPVFKHLRTSLVAPHMSAFGGKADKCESRWNFTGCMSALSQDQARPLWQTAGAQTTAALIGGFTQRTK